ncbi:MAG: pilin [Patescibacteria group bacterium]|jgi:hypothetical protein|nr:pilin [Patescibacteria group bacterium]
MLFKNNKIKKINKLLILSFFLIAFFVIPFITFSATTGSNNFQTIKFTPQIEFPNTGINTTTALSGQPSSDGVISSNLLSIYITAIYKYGLSVAGILAAIMLMGAGVIWLTSGGDSGKINKAKSLITGSIIGMFLLFGSYIILNTVNPNLIELKPIDLSTITRLDGLVCCHFEKGQKIVRVEYIDDKAYYLEGDNVGTEFLGCESSFPDYQQCADNSVCSKQSLLSYSTIDTGFKKYTGEEKEIYLCSKYKKSNVIGLPEIESTITCCDHDKGVIEYDVIYKDDEIFYNSGDKQGELFDGCEAAAVECPENKCKIGPQFAGQGKKSYYMCNILEQDYCCSCYIVKLFSADIITECTTTSNWLECAAYCEEKGAEADKTYKYDAKPDYVYSCDADNKCVNDY